MPIDHKQLDHMRAAVELVQIIKKHGDEQLGRHVLAVLSNKDGATIVLARDAFPGLLDFAMQTDRPLSVVVRPVEVNGETTQETFAQVQLDRDDARVTLSLNADPQFIHAEMLRYEAEHGELVVVDPNGVGSWTSRSPRVDA